MNESYLEKIKENYKYFGGISFLYGIFLYSVSIKIFMELHFQYV